MTVLILNRMPLSNCPYHEWLEDSGEALVLYTSRQALDLPSRELERIRSRYEVFEVFDSFDNNGQIEWEAIKRHETSPFHHVVALSESDLIRAGFLRQRFGLPGQDVASALAFRDKVVMKDRLVAAAIPVTSYRPLLNISELIDFLEEHGAPVIVKPRNGAGSIGIKVIRSERDLEDFLATGLASTIDTASTLMVEKFIEGQMYHVDGLVQDGVIRFIWPSFYVTDGLAFIEGDIHAGYTLDAHNPLRRRLQDFVCQVLAVLPTPALSAFHAEVFETTDGELLLSEIASRPGGARINEAIYHAFGVHMLRSLVRGECECDLGLPQELRQADPQPRATSGWVTIPPRAGILQRAPSRMPYPWIIDYRLHFDIGDQMANAGYSTESLASFVVLGANEAELRMRIDDGVEWFLQNIIVKPAASVAEQPLIAGSLELRPNNAASQIMENPVKPASNRCC